MDSFPILALPPELRVKIYRYLLPTVAHPPAYLGLRLSCSTIQREYDYEALLRLRCVYRSVITSYPDLPFTFDIPSECKDIRTLSLRTKPPKLKIFQDLLSYEVVPWGFRRLRSFTVTHEPSGVEQYDNFIIGSVYNGIVMGITDHHVSPIKNGPRRAASMTSAC